MDALTLVGAILFCVPIIIAPWVFVRVYQYRVYIISQVFTFSIGFLAAISCIGSGLYFMNDWITRNVFTGGPHWANVFVTSFVLCLISLVIAFLVYQYLSKLVQEGYDDAQKRDLEDKSYLEAEVSLLRTKLSENGIDSSDINRERIEEYQSQH